MLWQGSPAAGTAIVISLGVVPSTAAVTPATVTAVFATLRNPVPLIVAVAPGARVAGSIEAIVGATEPAGAETVTTSEPDTPSLDAVMVVTPGLSALNRPLPSTIATSGSDELHVIRRPTSAVPFRSLTTTLRGVVSPATGGPASGEITTVKTGACATVMAADPDFPSTVAVMVVEPAPSPVTRPALDTLATAVFADDQASVFPVIVAPV